MYLHTCIHVYMHTHTHTHTHTHLRLAARCHGAHESGIPKIARMSTSVQMLALLQAHFYFDLQSILGLKLVLGFLGSTTVCFDFCLFPLQPCRKPLQIVPPFFHYGFVFLSILVVLLFCAAFLFDSSLSSVWTRSSPPSSPLTFPSPTPYCSDLSISVCRLRALV